MDNILIFSTAWALKYKQSINSNLAIAKIEDWNLNTMMLKIKYSDSLLRAKIHLYVLSDQFSIFEE